MGRRARHAKRTSLQAAADRHADDIAHGLGKALRAARRRRGLSQAAAAALAGLSPSTWSYLELARDGRASVATWNRAASAVGSSLKAYLAEISGTDLPRDAVHLRHQELIIATAKRGGWRALPEAPLDAEVSTSRMADVLLRRDGEYALIEVWDWFADVGAVGRAWHRRLAALERYAIARMPTDVVPRVGGAWVVRATRRNRELVAAHSEFFAALLPGSSAAWLRALTERDSRMPAESALIWVSVTGTRLFASRVRKA